MGLPDSLRIEVPGHRGSRRPSMSNFDISEDGDQEEIKDHWCDPENPKIIRCVNVLKICIFSLLFRFEEVSAAAYRIRDGVVRTSCDPSHMNADTGINMYFKKEYMQYTGSFKERGAR